MKTKWLCPSRLWMLAALALGAVGFIAYIRSGVTEFTPALSRAALIAFGVGVGLSLLAVLWNVKAVRFGAYLALLYALLKSVSVQATYIVNVFVSIDGNRFTLGFLLTAVATLLAAAAALIGVCCRSGGEGAA